MTVEYCGAAPELEVRIGGGILQPRIGTRDPLHDDLLLARDVGRPARWTLVRRNGGCSSRQAKDRDYHPIFDHPENPFRAGMAWRAPRSTVIAVSGPA